MRVLVTGADGFVGEHLVAALLGAGHAVTGGMTGPEPTLRTLSPELAARVDWVVFDLRDAGSVAALVADAAPDAVVHLAGLSSVSQSWREPEATLQVNAMGALHLMLAIRALPGPGEPRPVVLVGSGEAYGRDGTDDAPLREDAPLRPVNPYGASKAAQEMIGFALGSGPHVRLVQTRSFQQVGPGQRPTFVTVDWARQLVRIRDEGAEPVLRVGNLGVTRDFLDVRDAAAAYMALLESDAAGVYNVCSGAGRSLRELLGLLQEIVGAEVELEVDAGRLRPADIHSLVGDPARIMADTDWRPRRPLEASLRDVVAALGSPAGA